jgi:DNA-binding LytR/AlgR family response regulator
VRIAICEDEIFQQRNIDALLKKWAVNSHQEIDVSIFDSAEALLMLWGDVIFDILILDIEMKRMNGMELARTIRRLDENVIIIFVTGHASYSLEGYDVNPLHYLVKPLQEQKLFNALDKANAIYKLKGSENFVIQTEDGLRKVFLNTVYYIAMYSHNAEVYTADGTYNTRITIKELSQALPTHFIACHRSYIINMFKVNCIFNDRVVMEDNTEIPVSRGRIKHVREFFIQLRTR